MPRQKNNVLTLACGSKDIIVLVMKLDPRNQIFECKKNLEEEYIRDWKIENESWDIFDLIKRASGHKRLDRKDGRVFNLEVNENDRMVVSKNIDDGHCGCVIF